MKARWSTCSYRKQQAGASPGQQRITQYFDCNVLSDFIDKNEVAKISITNVLGTEKNTSIKPILQKLMENAERNSNKKSSHGFRHDETTRKFAASLFCLTGKAAYEMLQANFGSALPSVATIHRIVASQNKIQEGDFRFDALVEHLKQWNAPMGVHIQLDDTRILKRIEYDPVLDRFVGFCLPIKDGLPDGNAFVFQTFQEIETAYAKESSSSYAHCIVAKPVTLEAPAFVLFVLGTDSKYTHSDIGKRWQHISKELQKRNVKVFSNGADGAGPFMKAMISQTSLFHIAEESNVPKDWSFFMMPTLRSDCLCAQDTVHLLAKLRTRLIMPSNILSIGAAVACRGHLIEVLKQFPKSRHGLSQRSIDSKDKQNYTSISFLLKPCVEQCLKDLNSKMETSGTVIYLQLMRAIRDCFFDKPLSPLKRLYLIWKVIYFVRIWKTWLTQNGLGEADHFITNNAYLCIELNGHMLTNLVFNVIMKIFPVECFRVWITGSQACEQLFRLLRSMTSTFSTIVNFSLKGILERIHKLQFISASEADESIVFPRLQRRILQTREESDQTFLIPTIEAITEEIRRAKLDAVELSLACGMKLVSYDDEDLIKDTEKAVNEAVINDQEPCEDSLLMPEMEQRTNDVMMNEDEAIAIREDLSQLKLKKNDGAGIPTYSFVESRDAQSATSYKLEAKTHQAVLVKSPFVEYDGAFIRKTTALYLLQENFQVSNDRLLRVRSQQPTHVFATTYLSTTDTQRNVVKSGDMCLFKRVDDPSKSLLGRIVQFSYLKGNKRARQYSSDYVDMTKASYKTVGAFSNWFQGTKLENVGREKNIDFKPLDLVFTPGYVSMENYICTVDDSLLILSNTHAFSIPVQALKKFLPRWKEEMTFDIDTDDLS